MRLILILFSLRSPEATVTQAGGRIAGIVAAALTLSLVGSPGALPAGAAIREQREKKVSVVASFYPLAEAASRVGKRYVSVQNLVPPGTEPHDFELSTREIDAIDGADLAIVMGDDFQPAVEKAADRRDGPTLMVLAKFAGQLRAGDPHVWLDPNRMIEVVNATADALANADRKHAADYRSNAQMYVTELATLDSDYRAGLEDCSRRLFVTSHDAFGYLADTYDLKQEGVNGINPDAEPNPKRLGELADLARDKGVTTIFTEDLVSPRVARTVAREAGGLRVDTLSPLEGLTAKQLKSGDDYLSVMRANLTKLRRALGCT